jgi:hypothetical protein
MSGYSLWKFDPIIGKSKGKGTTWAGKGKAKGQGKSLELMRVFTPINNNLLPWYGCTRPDCPGKWCYGNNPPDFCGLCWDPCGKTRPLAGKGEPMAPGAYQKGQAKGVGKGKGGGKGGGKDNRIARPDEKDKDDTKGKGKGNEAVQVDVYDKDTTLDLINKLVANGNKEVADSISLTTGIFYRL